MLALSGCGGTSKQPTPTPVPQPPPPPAPGGETVNGTERLGWDQDVIPGTRIGNYQFVSFVDGTSVALSDVTCTPNPQVANAASCSTPIPKMSPGSHEIRLAAIRNLGGSLVQSDRSAPIVVVMLASSTPAASLMSSDAWLRRPAGAAAPDRGRAADGRFTPRVEVVARGLEAVADVAIADGTVFVAERRGTIRTVRDGALLPESAMVLDETGQPQAGFGLLSIALHPKYATNRRIYMLYTAPTHDGMVYRLATGRELAGRIGEFAVLLDNVDAVPGAWAVIRFGPDGKLYAAFPSVPGRAARDGYSGRILRLNDDGTVPADNLGGSAGVAAVDGVPLALEWSVQEEMPSVLRVMPDGTRELASGRAATVRTTQRAPLVWRAGERPAAVARYQGTSIPSFVDRLIVPLLDGGVVTVDGVAGGDARAGLRLGAEYGAARAVAVSAAGDVYVGTANGDVRPADSDAAAYRDVLLRIRGASAAPGGNR